MKTKSFILILAGLISAAAFVTAQPRASNVNVDADAVYFNTRAVLERASQSAQLTANLGAQYGEPSIQLVFNGRYTAFQDAIVALDTAYANAQAR